MKRLWPHPHLPELVCQMVHRCIRWMIRWFLTKPGGIDVLRLLLGCVVRRWLWDLLLTRETTLGRKSWGEELASGCRLLLLLCTMGAIRVSEGITRAVVHLRLPGCVLATPSV